MHYHYAQTFAELDPRDYKELKRLDAVTPLLIRRQYTVTEAAAFLAVNDKTLHGRIRSGTIEPDLSDPPRFFLTTLIDHALNPPKMGMRPKKRAYRRHETD